MGVFDQICNVCGTDFLENKSALKLQELVKERIKVLRVKVNKPLKHGLDYSAYDYHAFAQLISLLEESEK